MRNWSKRKGTTRVPYSTWEPRCGITAHHLDRSPGIRKANEWPGSGIHLQAKILESRWSRTYRHASPTIPPAIFNNVLTLEIRTSTKIFPPPQRSTASVCILHVWSATSDKLANEVLKAWQEIRTDKIRLDKAKTIFWSGPDDICTARINTARKR